MSIHQQVAADMPSQSTLLFASDLIPSMSPIWSYLPSTMEPFRAVKIMSSFLMTHRGCKTPVTPKRVTTAHYWNAYIRWKRIPIKVTGCCLPKTDAFGHWNSRSDLTLQLGSHSGQNISLDRMCGMPLSLSVRSISFVSDYVLQTTSSLVRLRIVWRMR